MTNARVTPWKKPDRKIFWSNTSHMDAAMQCKNEGYVVAGQGMNGNTFVVFGQLPKWF